MPERTTILLDVDTGIDDSLALLYAAASVDAELVGVTCVSGNVDLPRVQRNTRAVLELAGREDVEVAAGRPVPLIRELETTPETHGPEGIGWAVLPEPRRPLSDRFGPDVIVEAARRRPSEITLVTLGPVTNLAIALLREPELPRLLRRWVLMGGSYRVPGNTKPTVEWNIHCDPEAAKLAFASFASMPDAAHPLALGLDVTERAVVLPEHLVALARRAGSRPDDSLGGASDGSALETRSVASNPIVRYLADALRFYMEFHAKFDGFYGAFIHDALAVATALDPSLVRTESVAVDVETAGTLTAGETVADWRHHWSRPPCVDVAVEADARAFLDRFIERVGGLAERRGSVMPAERI
jgi:purine nucleosidase